MDEESGFLASRGTLFVGARTEMLAILVRYFGPISRLELNSDYGVQPLIATGDHQRAIIGYSLALQATIAQMFWTNKWSNSANP